MKQQILVQKINEILSDWDPIGVQKPVSDDEYKGYVPEIMRVIDDEQKLRHCIINIIDQIGMSYDRDNAVFQESIKSVVAKISALSKE